MEEDVADVPVELAPEELVEDLSEDAFLAAGCGCTRYCCKQFPSDVVLGV